MFDCRRGILLVILAFSLAGCADSETPIDLRVGLFVAEAERLSARLHNPGKGIEESELRGLDKALKSTITKACRRAFDSVHALESDPMLQMTDNSQLDLVVVTKLKGTGGTYGYHDYRGESDFSLSVKLTFYTREMKQVTSIKASGSGTAESIGILFAPHKRALVKSVRAAIRDLGDDLTRQALANRDLRKIANQHGK